MSAPRADGGRGARRRRKRRKAGAAPPSSRPPPRALRFSLRRWITGGLALVAFAASAWLFLLYPAERGPGEGRAVELVVPGSLGAHDLAALLAGAGVVGSPRLFELWVRATGGTSGVVAGNHLFTDDATPRELMARLERRSGGGSARVTFPEGWTRFDMARRLQDRHVVSLRDFLEATTDAALLHDLGLAGDTAEGFLFPATYDLSLDSDARDVVRRMKHEFDRRWDIASHAHSATLNDVMTSASLGVRDVVTLASMVEKEAAVDEERATIASVFLNRLRDPAFHPKRL
ncbi:MAG TPA: endolytic transglycosylase MltG, partial [Polyangiaceae bacterium]|nr:endolytic transglycosylase MltG [Polyangiaceae bacterium]